MFFKKSVNEWVAEYENEKLWCMVWSKTKQPWFQLLRILECPRGKRKIEG